jgi:ATP-dependent DNA helicase UvrD/PcrA
MPPWDDGLEGRALEIARTDDNPVRVDAGPGTGKTFALMRRVWRLIATGADPRRIFVGTFTRTAASDLKKSLSELGIQGVGQIRAGTIHGYCFGLLAQHEVFEWTRRAPRPLLDFEERFLVEDIGAEFGTVSERQDRLEAFADAYRPGS